MGLGRIFENIVDAVTGRSDDENEAGQNAEPQMDGADVLPASEDPLGDPADDPQNVAQYGDADVLPASQDPLGDPADDPNTLNEDILPASEDPLGDPADQQPYRQ